MRAASFSALPFRPFGWCIFYCWSVVVVVVVGVMIVVWIGGGLVVVLEMAVVVVAVGGRRIDSWCFHHCSSNQHSSHLHTR
jgi:hypothetical protein